jgi:hypothetical protein
MDKDTESVSYMRGIQLADFILLALFTIEIAIQVLGQGLSAYVFPATLGNEDLDDM